ncbi:hypothetical protein [Aromatoleum buckelii]|uniref:DUF2214 domain-containing protein n=1 Tax=Aromatoleum buckelii TaxID=200254 RepID=A0ABX1N562_9RHOO|nr:hypothetical protein [Aromatoleum buckelii]MCK0511718.1 hypothetical protein [Aromatoleum buckelii]
MFGELLAAIDASALSVHLRHSIWLYPVVSAAHILGIALLVGAIVPMDARLIGVWPSLPVALFARTILPFAASGCILAIGTGMLLFIVQPADYAALPVFWTKMALVLAGVANALVLRRSTAWRRGIAETTGTTQALRLSGSLSLAIWLTTLFLGRLLGFL